MGDTALARVEELVTRGVLQIEDGNHGEYRPLPGEFVSRGTPFIRAADLHDGVIDFGGAGAINDIAFARIRKGVGAPLDVLLSHKGTVGKVAQAPADSPNFVCSPQTTFWRSLDADEIDPRYLRFALESNEFVGQLEAIKSESDMAPYVSLTQQRLMKIPLPDIRDQRAIAEVLGALDDKIAANARLAATTDDLARAEFQLISKNARETRALGDLMRLEYGKALPATRRVPGPVPVYGSGGIGGWHDQALVAGPGVILGRKGSVGTVYWSQIGFFPIDTTFYVSPLGGASLEFLYYAIESQQFGADNSDSAVPGLNRDEALRKTVQWPGEAQVAQFTETTRALIQARVGFGNQNRALEVTRDTLLPQLMSGKLRVREAAEMAGL